MRARLGHARRLVGLSFPADAQDLPYEGCLVLRNGQPVGGITSIGFSPTRGHYIALSYVHVEDAEEGSRVTIRCRNGALVVTPVVGRGFFDPDNKRQEL